MTLRECPSCGAPLDALGSCLGVCDPADAADDYTYDMSGSNDDDPDPGELGD
jgi:hypothetical protein